MHKTPHFSLEIQNIFSLQTPPMDVEPPRREVPRPLRVESGERKCPGLSTLLLFSDNSLSLSLTGLD